jgi:hypothetical protein
MENITIQIPFTMNQDFVDDVMCDAFEGGINYWCGGAEVQEKIDGESDYKGQPYIHGVISREGTIRVLVEPFEDDCKMSEEYPEYAEYILTLPKFVKGYRKYAEWAMQKNKEVYTDPAYIDAEIADIIIQFALFDEIVFG